MRLLDYVRAMQYFDALLISFAVLMEPLAAELMACLLPGRRCPASVVGLDWQRARLCRHNSGSLTARNQLVSLNNIQFHIIYVCRGVAMHNVFCYD